MSARSTGGATPDGEPHVLIEANVGEGVVSAPLSKYFRYHTRICRPVGLTEADCATVCGYAIARIGFGYDLKNILDLMRYLFPLPMPQRWRRRMIALGSGDPTRLICSALIADAFNAVRYPILPKITLAQQHAGAREILEIRHSSLYCPRDFDISPYFKIVKPTIAQGFDYKALHWADLPRAPDDAAPATLVARSEERRRTPAPWSPDAQRPHLYSPAARRYLCRLVEAKNARRRHQCPRRRCSRRRCARCCGNRSRWRWR